MDPKKEKSASRDFGEGKSPGGSSSRIKFENFLGQGRVNQLGGVFINGRPLPPEKRLQIVEMARQGVKPCKISRELKVSHGAVSKILMRFNETGSISPGQIGGNPRSRISIQAVRLHIHRICREHAGVGATQIQQILVQRGICSPQNVPSGSRINRLLKAQKNSSNLGRRNGQGRGTAGKEAARIGRPGEGPAGPGKPLSHSIENILGSGTEPAAGESGAVALCADSNPCSSHSSTFNQPIPSGSDEENQQQSGVQSQQGMQENRRARTSFSQEQLRVLEKTFRENPYPGQTQKEWLVRLTQLDEDKIITWFSNRRARSRRKAFQHFPSFQQILLPAFHSPTPATDQNGNDNAIFPGPKQFSEQEMAAKMTVQTEQQAQPAIFQTFPSIPAALFPMFFPPFGNVGFSALPTNSQNFGGAGGVAEGRIG